MQLIGIAYNPKKVKTPPTSWEDLWKPEYKGRVGITGLGSSLGTAFMVEIAKMNGGSETNIEPAFEAMKKLLPNVGAISPSPGALAALFQQGEIDIAFNYWNNVALLAAKGVDIAFASPKTGAVAGPLQRTDRQEQSGPEAGSRLSRYGDVARGPESS